MIPWFPLCHLTGVFPLSWAAVRGIGNDGKEMESEGTVPKSRYEDAPVVEFTCSLFFHWMLPASKLLEHHIAVFSSATPWCPLRCAGWGWLQVTGNAAGKQPLVRELTPAFIYFSGVNTALRMRGSFADVPSEFEIVFFLKGMYLEEIAAPKHQVMLSYYRLLFVCLFLLPTIMAKLPSCKQWAVWIALLFIIVRPRCVFFFRSYLHKKAQ